MVRLQRLMADRGVAARRVCEAMIEGGRVRVNGRVVDRLPVFVNPGADTIEIDGRPLPGVERPVYVMYHKPERVLVASADEPGSDRRTVTDLVQHPSGARLFPVGRLDFDATGLVLLTNDGELANRLTHPRYGVARTYEVVLKGSIAADQIASIQKDLGKLQRRAERRRAGLGVAPDRADRADRAGGRRDGRAQPEPERADGAAPLPSLYEGGAGRASIEVARSRAEGTTLRVTLLEGRNRQLPEVLRRAGCQIRKMTRVGIGPLELRGVALGAWRELTRDELRDLKRQGGPGGKGRARAPMAPVTRPVGPPPAVTGARRSDPAGAGVPVGGGAPAPAFEPVQGAEPIVREWAPGPGEGSPGRPSRGDQGLIFRRRAPMEEDQTQTPRRPPRREARP